MNNEMISVPRGTLQKWLDDIGPSRHVTQYASLKRDELRALLGKPTAQPQGEPVAWMYRREGGECLGQLVQMESDSLKDIREGKVVEGRRILWPRDDYIDWKPLYAEQPA